MDYTEGPMVFESIYPNSTNDSNPVSYNSESNDHIEIVCDVLAAPRRKLNLVSYEYSRSWISNVLIETCKICHKKFGIPSSLKCHERVHEAAQRLMQA